ncbi:MAG: hypothetical protein ACJ8IK_11860 [Burkholderiaceae bacterium]|jgi:hypothetical protein
MLRRLLPLLAIPFVLAGCDQLGLEPASVTAARVEADGKAVGAACRHGGRAIEDCFTLNKRVDKAAIYAGWREMDDYMRENKLEAVAPTLGAPVQKADDGAADAATAKADGDKAADKTARAVGPKGDKAEKVVKADKAGGDKPAEH